MAFQHADRCEALARSVLFCRRQLVARRSRSAAKDLRLCMMPGFNRPTTKHLGQAKLRRSGNAGVSSEGTQAIIRAAQERPLA